MYINGRRENTHKAADLAHRRTVFDDEPEVRVRLRDDE